MEKKELGGAAGGFVTIGVVVREHRTQRPPSPRAPRAEQEWEGEKPATPSGVQMNREQLYRSIVSELVNRMARHRQPAKRKSSPIATIEREAVGKEAQSCSETWRQGDWIWTDGDHSGG